MAFNPFNSFRKHKTGIFAGLVIVCMFTFILSSGLGKGDFFYWLVDLIGAGRQGDEVVKLYGKKVYTGDLQKLAQQRETAERFLGVVLAHTRESTSRLSRERVAKAMEAKPPRPDKDEFVGVLAEMVALDAALNTGLGLDSKIDDGFFRQLIQSMIQPFVPLMPLGRGELIAAEAAFARKSPQGRHRAWDSRKAMVSAQESRLATAGQVEDQRLARGWMLLIDLNAYSAQQAAQGVKRPLLFGGSTRRQDLLDVLVWQKQADVLGIKFTDDDLRQEVNSLYPFQPPLLGNEDGADEKFVAMVFPDRQTTLQDVREALKLEYRASLARGVVLGDFEGLRGVQETLARTPTTVTPAQYLDYYRDKRTQHRVDLLPVPVSAFVSSRLRPTETEVEALYKAGKDVVARPDDPRPGFKIPKKFRVEWVRASPAPLGVYKKAARALPMAGFLATATDERANLYKEKASAFVPAQIAAMNPWNLAWVALQIDTAAQDHPGKRGGVLETLQQPGLFDADPELALITAHTYRYTVAATLGQLAGPSFCLNGAEILAVTYPATSAAWAKRNEHRWGIPAAVKDEREHRSRLVAGILGSAVGSPTQAAIPAAFAAANQHDDGYLPPVRKNVPVWVVRGRVMREVQAGLERRLLENDVDQLVEDLKKAKGDAKKCESLIADAVKKYKLEAHHGKSEYLDDPFTAAKDPGLAALREAFQKRFGGRGDFASLFTRADDVYVPADALQARWTAEGEWFVPWDSGNDATYYYWKTESHKEATPSLDEARDDVERVWRLREARKIAQEVASQIRARVAGKSPEDVRKLFRDPKALQQLLKEPSLVAAVRAKKSAWGDVVEDVASGEAPWGEVIAIEKLSRQHSHESGRWTPFPIERHVTNPTSDFVERLLKLSPKQAVVLRDSPDQTYYVGYMEGRLEAPLATTAFQQHAGGNPRDDLFGPLDQEQKAKFRQTLMEELRREAGKIDSRGRFVLNPNVKEEKEDSSDPGL